MNGAGTTGLARFARSPHFPARFSQTSANQDMKIHYLRPPEGNAWLSPEEVVIRFRNAFPRIDVDAEAARKQGATILGKYQALRDAGLGDANSLPVAKLEERWDGALAILVVTNENANEWFQTIACNSDHLRLDFGPGVTGRRRKPIAVLAAKALGYRVQSTDGD